MGKKKEKDGVCRGYKPDLNKSKELKKLVRDVKRLNENDTAQTKEIYVLTKVASASIDVISRLSDRLELLEARYSLLEEITRPFLHEIVKDIMAKDEGSDAANRLLEYEEELTNTLTHFASDTELGHKILEVYPEENDPFLLLSHSFLSSYFRGFLKVKDLYVYSATSAVGGINTPPYPNFDPIAFSQVLSEIKMGEKLEKAEKAMAKALKKVTKAAKKSRKAKEILINLSGKSCHLENDEEFQSFLDSLEVEGTWETTEEPEAEPETKETTEE